MKTLELLSVKRLSDGEIFSVGDRVSTTNNQYFDGIKISNEKSKVWHPDYNDTTILKFITVRNNSRKLVIVAVFSCRTQLYGQEIDYLEKIVENVNIVEELKKVIFTTEDGVDKYIGDDYFIIYPTSSGTIYPGTVTECMVLVSEAKRFSTRESATEYIRDNTPLLTYKEVMEIIKSRTNVRTKLKRLAEEKLM